MKTILSFLLASVALWASAQTYHPLVDESKLSSTKHFYCLDNEPTTDYVRFESDTVIGVYTYKHTWCYTNEAMNQRTLRGFIREDIAAKKVYFRYAAAGNEYLLYDFNAAVGDSVWLIDPYFVYVVDSIGTFTLLSGEERRSLKLHSKHGLKASAALPKVF
jgi:hypothetical protein